jgi:hypothetical protein
MKRFSIALVATLAACSSGEKSNADLDDAPDSVKIAAQEAHARAAQDSAMREARKALIPKGETAPPAVPAAENDPPAGEWDITPKGIGAVKAGMSLDEVRVVMHDNLAIPAKVDECQYIRPKKGGQGVAFMFEKNTLSRVDVTSGSSKTVEGVGIGDTEAKINSVYSGRVKSGPAKYGNGHTLVVTPKNGSDYRIVFETDGSKVTKFRSGREPAVEYVEGCG